MKRALLIATALALVVPPSAGAATNSTVTIEDFVSGSPSYMYGFVKSPKKACKNNRKVTLYYKDAGPDTKVGSDKTEPGKGDSYVWKVKSKFIGGKYYAKIVQEDGCEGDTSKVFDLE